MTHRIVIYYEVWTPEDVEAGETYDRGEESDVEVDWDPDDETVAEATADSLDYDGAAFASSSAFHPGIWYLSEDELDYRSGERTIRSFHLKGYTKREEREVYRLMKARGLT